jgi:uncharacterized protein (DUF1778 family)
MAGNKNSGRKPKAKTERADQAVTAWLTSEDKRLVERAAKVARVATGKWLGNVGVEAARRLLASMGL